MLRSYSANKYRPRKFVRAQTINGARFVTLLDEHIESIVSKSLPFIESTSLFKTFVRCGTWERTSKVTVLLFYCRGALLVKNRYFKENRILHISKKDL